MVTVSVVVMTVVPKIVVPGSVNRNSSAESNMLTTSTRPTAKRFAFSSFSISSRRETRSLCVDLRLADGVTVSLGFR